MEHPTDLTDYRFGVFDVFEHFGTGHGVDAVVGEGKTLSCAGSEFGLNMVAGFPERGHRGVDPDHVVSSIRQRRRQESSSASDVEDPRTGIESGILEGRGHIGPTDRVEHRVKAVKEVLWIPPALLIKDC